MCFAVPVEFPKVSANPIEMVNRRKEIEAMLCVRLVDVNRIARSYSQDIPKVVIVTLV
jgi:hypothetical protein